MSTIKRKSHGYDVHNDLFTIELVDSLLLGLPIVTLNNIFPGGMSPSKSFIEYDGFRNELLETNERISNLIQYENETDTDQNGQLLEVKNELDTNVGGNWDFESPDTIVDEKIKVIYAVVTYPLTNVAYFRLEIKAKQPITYGMLLYGHTLAYESAYKLEDCDIGNHKHIRQFSFGGLGRSGIRESDTENLVYSGGSQIEIHENYIVCHFNCEPQIN